MIEKVFNMAPGGEVGVKRVIFDDNVNIIHMRFQKDSGLPEHLSNSNVYMTVLGGTLSIGLGEQEINEYPSGTILSIPKGIKMNVRNRHEGTLELLVLKAPAPGK